MLKRLTAYSGENTGTTGIIIMLAAMLMFSLNDTVGKMLVATFSVGQVLLIRSVAALIILAPFIWRQGLRSLFAVQNPWLQLFRVILGSVEVFCFYYAVTYLPLADVMTYWLASPIYVAAMAPFLLGEKVGWRRWSAILVGFVGVVIALDPAGASFGPGTIASIIGPMVFALFMMSGRALRGTPDTTLVFWQMIGSGLAGAATAPFGWVPPQMSDFALLSLLGVVAMMAHMLVNRALKLADAATIAPLQYTLLFWAIIFGFVFFGDVPQLHTILGAALIVAAGIFIFLREQALKRQGKV